ncbi:ethionine resistance protein [Coemansia sp. RSA 2706]|nr:ethionine resistance protein [Coemansia sp. RSA 2711]KAJ2305533.1 ethionine resistance protein [Coemansia sp. RSA 2706]KAJ2309266.1 ethionine resistance protein [Coemansia sp. RSA 2704]KAJ2327586.1 ethionine resistance protein [Coemansia sp. RSA 2702]KAJ2364443.1 ethionine resistance protein [Coemansia sp. RSA 2610]
MSMLASTSRVSSQETLQGDIAQGYCADPAYDAAGLEDGAYLLTTKKKRAPYSAVAKEEFSWLAASSVPIVATYFLQFSLGFANFVAIGNLGAKELAATSLAYMVSGVFALAPALGYASAMDTFCSSAYTASTDKTLVGLHFQRGVVAVVLHLIPVSVIFLNMESMMLLLGQDADVAALCGEYMRVFLPGVLPWALYECTKRYLQAQGIMRASTIVILVCAPLHWLNSYLLILSPSFGLGYIGAPLNLTITFWLMFLGIWVYAMTCRQARECWGGWTRECLRGLGAFYKLGIPAVVTTCGEWWAYEALSLLASFFGAEQLAAQAIIINIVSLSSQIPSAMGFTSTPRIGNLLGAGRARQARISAHIITIMTIVVGMATTVSFVIYREWWGHMYSNDPEVVRIVVDLMPIAGVFLTCNGLNQVFAAILRGLGRQKLGAYIIVPSFNLIGLPLSVFLAYGPMRMEVSGLWWGACVGTVASALIQLFVIIYYTDWEKEVERCLRRLIISGPRSASCLTLADATATPVSDDALCAHRPDGYGSIV